MAKELPYFKFFPAEYNSGTIQICSLEAQGLFINLCTLYWQRNCYLDKAFAKTMLSKCSNNVEALLNELFKHGIFSVNNEENLIVIDFLDEQFSQFTKIRSKRVKSGILGGKANAKQMLKHRKANALNKDKDKDKDKDKIYTKKKFGEFVSLTDDEYKKLIAEDGKDFTDACIRRLDNYLGSNGKKYKSHYRTILSWVRDAETEKGGWKDENKNNSR